MKHQFNVLDHKKNPITYPNSKVAVTHPEPIARYMAEKLKKKTRKPAYIRAVCLDGQCGLDLEV